MALSKASLGAIGLSCTQGVFELELGRPLASIRAAAMPELDALAQDIAHVAPAHSMSPHEFTRSLVQKMIQVLANAVLLKPQQKAELWEHFAISRRKEDRTFRSNHLNNDQGDYWFVGGLGYLLIIDHETGDVYRGKLTLSQAEWQTPRIREDVEGLSRIAPIAMELPATLAAAEELHENR